MNWQNVLEIKVLLSSAHIGVLRVINKKPCLGVLSNIFHTQSVQTPAQETKMNFVSTRA